MDNISLANTPKKIIGKNPLYQHTKTQVKDSDLYIILSDLRQFLGNLPLDINDLQFTLSQYINDILTQCKKDNAKALLQANEILNTALAILTNTRLSELNAPLYNIVKGIDLIFKQYVALLEYIQIYVAQTQYEVKDDNPAHAKSFYDYVDSVFNVYVYELLAPAEFMDSIESSTTKYALYSLLMQADSSIVDKYTNIAPFASILQSVQNNRIYRNRETMIITLGEAIAVCNLIRVMWYLYKLTYATLGISNADSSNLYQQLLSLINQFLANRNPNLLSDILALINQLQDELASKGDASNDLSQIASALLTIQKLQKKTWIERYSDFLDRLSQRINALNALMSSFKINIDMQWLNDLLTPLVDFLNDIVKWLSSDILSKYYNQVNELIAVVNKTIQTLKDVTCALKQAMCLINNAINFYDKNLIPAIKQIKDEALRAKDSAETILNEVEKSVLGKVEKALRLLVYEKARLKLKSQSTQAYMQAGDGYTIAEFGKLYNDIVDTIINQALDLPTPNVLSSLKEQARQIVNEVYNDLKEQATNPERCQPVLQITNLKIPNLTLRSNIPRLNKINLDIKC